jgi:hypothetical protein
VHLSIACTMHTRTYIHSYRPYMWSHEPSAWSCLDCCTFCLPLFRKGCHIRCLAQLVQRPRPPLQLLVINQKRPSRKRNIIRDGQTAIDPCFPSFPVSSFLCMLPGVHIYCLTTCARSKHPHFFSCLLLPLG